MSSAQQNFNTGQAQAKTEANFQAAKDSASEAADRAQAAYNTTGQAREENKEEATGLLQQTGEQVKNMAQGAMDTVKHTLGMDKN